MFRISPSSILRALLGVEARLTLLRQSPRIVVVTGSAGKTSAKELIRAAIGTRYSVRGSGEEGNHLLIMAILGQPPLRYSAREAAGSVLRGTLAPIAADYPEWLILEVDASAPDRAASAGRMLRPEVVVFTSLGEIPPHVEAFATRDELVRETTSICQSVGQRGVLVVNGDDRELHDAVVRASAGRRIVAFGFAENCEVRALHAGIDYEEDRPRGLSLSVEVAGSLLSLTLPGAVGRPHAYAALAAIGVVHALAIPADVATDAFSTVPRRPGRLRLLEGSNRSTLIDDSWNPSPDAWQEALRTLGAITRQGRRIVIAGGMAGLGDHENAIHEGLGESAGRVSDLLIAVGPWGDAIARGAARAGMGSDRAVVLANPVQAADYIRPSLTATDLVLVTAAGAIEGVGMEHIVERLLLRPELKRELLVRQIPWWRPGQ